MDVIVLTIILLLAAIKFGKYIKKYFNILCIIIIAFSIFAYFSDNTGGNILSGYTGFAFFIVVMFQTAFKKGSLLYKKTLSVRKEYSIFGFIFIIPHALIFLLGEHQVLEWNGIISAVIMIPLFITSFILIRKKMTPEHWKKLHLLSYAAYLLIFAHIILVSLGVNKIVYLVLFLLYLFLKIKNDGFSKLDTTYKKSITFVALLLTLSINLYVYTINNNFTDSKNSQYTDGIYYGEANGYKGLDVKVNVEINNDKIMNIEILSFGGTEPHDGVNFEQSVDTLKNQIVASQSLDLDTVSGATKSTTGLKKAINMALKQAETANVN